MNSIVFVLIVISSNGHFYNPVIPTLEFSTEAKCEKAIVAFEQESKGQTGHVRMRCIRIEK